MAEHPSGSPECAACGAPAQGNYSINRDAICDGPEVPLCDACGGGEEPTCEELWARIARRQTAHVEGRFCGSLSCTDEKCIEAECAALPLGGHMVAALLGERG
jgi:hypothetical protein